MSPASHIDSRVEEIAAMPEAVRTQPRSLPSRPAAGRARAS